MAKRRQVSGAVQSCSGCMAEKETEVGRLKGGKGRRKRETGGGSERDSDLSLHFDCIDQLP